MFIGSTYAQDNAQVKASVQLSSLLHYNMSRKLLKDTNQVVMFAFRVDVHFVIFPKNSYRNKCSF
jgi:hypothetical protein